MSTPPLRIIGGGLAGLGLGRALAARGIPVELHEAESYPRHKVCGEFITGLSPQTRAALDLDPLLAEAPIHLTVRWHGRHGPLLTWKMPEPALGISRWSLDHALAQAFVAAGGNLHVRSRFRMPATDGNPAAVVGLIQSTGRLPASVKDRGVQWIGLKVHLLPPFELAADLEVHLGRDAYVGLSRVEHGRVNLCGLFRKRLLPPDSTRPLLERYLAVAGLHALSERVRSATIDETSRTAVAGLDFRRDTPGIQWMRLGDSRGMIPPYTGHGMAMAFESAALALDPLSDFVNGRKSWHETVALVRDRHRHRFAGTMGRARWLHPMLYQPRRQRVLSLLARSRLLPLNPLYRLTHA